MDGYDPMRSRVSMVNQEKRSVEDRTISKTRTTPDSVHSNGTRLLVRTISDQGAYSFQTCIRTLERSSPWGDGRMGTIAIALVLSLFHHHIHTSTESVLPKSSLLLLSTTPIPIPSALLLLNGIQSVEIFEGSTQTRLLGRRVRVHTSEASAYIQKICKKSMPSVGTVRPTKRI